MKNKKGFTLLELLAVIVILAIIALIAVPIILNMIENARKGAAKDSAYGYIEAVENYQAYEMLKGNDGLKEGIYNITENTTIGDTKYKKLTDLIKVKGKNPTFGKIGITKNGTVGTADMCVNEYPIRYENNKIEVLDGDCEDLGIALVYNISSEKWEASKTLEIMYPEGKYEYYYKLESGKAKVGEKELVIGEEIKVETNTVTMELLENSKITAWMVKNGKKISTRTYEETKIDNVEIGKVSGEIVTGYPTITEYGIKSSANLTITYEEQEGTSPYYSVDGGEWKKYNGSTPVSGSKVQVKLVRDKSGRSGEVVDAVISDSSPSDALPIDAYDGKEDTGLIINNNKITKYINIDSTVWNKSLKFIYSNDHGDKYDYMKVSFIKSNGEVDSSFDNIYPTKAKTKTEKEFVIPENTSKIEIYMVGYNTVRYFRLYEVALLNEPVINVEKVLPKITEYGIEKGYDLISFDYLESSTERLYSMDGTTWKKYEDKKIKIYSGNTIYVKGQDKDGNSTRIGKYTSVLTDALGENAYDGKEDTYVETFNTTQTKYMNVDSSMWNKSIKFTYSTDYGDKYDYMKVSFIKSNNEIDSSFDNIYPTTAKTKITKEFVVPENTSKIEIYMVGYNQVRRFYLYEVEIKNEPVINVEKVLPKLTENGIEKEHELISIDYFNTSIEKLYSMDGTTWKTYDGKKIKIYAGDTIYAKGKDSKKETKVVSYISSLLADAMPNVCFDGDEGEYNGLKEDNNTFGYWKGIKYFQINENLQGKQLKITYTKHAYGDLTLTFYKENNVEDSSITLKDATWTKTSQDVLVPTGTVKIGVNMTHWAQTGVIASNCIYEISVVN